MGETTEIDRCWIRIRLIDHILSALCAADMSPNGRKYLDKLKSDYLKKIKNETNSAKEPS